VQGEHEHVRRMKDRNGEPGPSDRRPPPRRGQDMRARVVFFSIEGCMKADAILSKGAAVFSVPRFAVGCRRGFPLSSTLRTSKAA